MIRGAGRVSVDLDAGGNIGLIVTLEAFQVRAETEYLKHVLHLFGGHVTDAARAMGISRGYANKLIRKRGLDPKTFRPVRDSKAPAESTP